MKKTIKFLIIISLLFLGVNCGNNKKGLLLLPPLAQEEGGPGVTPDSAANENNDTSTQESAPSVEVINNGNKVDTGSSNSGSSNSEPGVVVVPQQPADNSNSNTTQPPANSGNSDTTQPPANSGNSDTTQPAADNGNSDTTQPAADNGNSNTTQPPANSGNSDTTQPAADNSNSNTTQPPANSGNSDTTQPPAEETPAPVDDDIAVDPDEGEVTLPGNPNHTPQPPEDSDDSEDYVDNMPEKPEKPKPPVDPKCKANIVSIDTSKGRWYNTQEELLPHPRNPKKTIKAKGFHTYWQDQNLYVTIKSDCDGGRYRLILVAKNIHGPLPDFYHYFQINVRNETTGENIGNFKIRASDKHYHRGYIDLTLPKGVNTLNILWKNDAWKKGEYEANIQIKRIALIKIRPVKLKPILNRKGSVFCDSNGRWFVGTNPPSVYTYWKNQTVSYCMRTKQAGKYEVRIFARNAKNGLPLMPDYKEFKVLVASGGKSEYITIKAEDKNVNKGTATIDLPAGDVVLNVTWLNDRYQPPKYDANIEITYVSIKRVGNSSAIASFLLQYPDVSFKILLPLSLLILGAIGLITWYRSRKLA